MAANTGHTARSVLNRFYEEETKFVNAKPGEQDPSVILTLFTEDFKLYQTSGLPYGGTYHGPQGFLQWLGDITQWCDKLEVRDVEIFEHEGSSRIMTNSTVYFRVKKTGEEHTYPMAQVYSIDLERGLIAELRPFYWDVYELNAKLGYDPKTRQ